MSETSAPAASSCRLPGSAPGGRSGEFDDFTPGVEQLTGRIGELITTGEIGVLLVGEPPIGLGILSFGPAIGLDESSGSRSVLLLNGWPTSSHLLRGVMPAIAHRTRVVAPDLPGFGDSSKPTDVRYDFAGHWESLDDDSNWQPWMDITLTRLAG